MAAEAGVSAGMVQHHFPTKHQMMTYALDSVRDAVHRRIAEQTPPDAPPRDRARVLLSQALPLDELRAHEMRTVLAMMTYTVARPAMLADVHDHATRFHATLAESIRTAPGAPGAAEPERSAMLLTALVDGLAMQVLLGGCSCALAVAVLESHLDQVFGPE